MNTTIAIVVFSMNDPILYGCIYDMDQLFLSTKNCSSLGKPIIIKYANKNKFNMLFRLSVVYPI